MGRIGLPSSRVDLAGQLLTAVNCRTEKKRNENFSKDGLKLSK